MFCPSGDKSRSFARCTHSLSASRTRLSRLGLQHRRPRSRCRRPRPPWLRGDWRGASCGSDSGVSVGKRRAGPAVDTKGGDGRTAKADGPYSLGLAEAEREAAADEDIPPPRAGRGTSDPEWRLGAQSPALLIYYR